MFYILLILFFVSNLFSYDDPFIDIKNKYAYYENNKLLINTKKITSKDCNKSICNNMNEYDINTLFVSSNFDDYYQIMYNEWINPQYIKEIKTFSKNDYLNKMKLNSNFKYILYNGTLLDNNNKLIKFKDNYIFLTIYNDVVVSEIKSINNVKYNKNNVVKFFSFQELLNLNTTNFLFLNNKKNLIIEETTEKIKSFLNE